MTAKKISSTASAYLEEALAIMQENSMNRQKVDWNMLRTQVFSLAQHAQTTAETYDAIRYALRALQDHHSFFSTPSQVDANLHATAQESPSPRGKLLLDRLGFVAIGDFTSGDPEQGAIYASTVQQLIRDIDAQDPCGWIVDLRENTGGNMWPMLAGLGALLGEGKVGAYVFPDGNQVAWFYKDGQALVEDYVRIQVNGPAYQLKTGFPPVAVLTGIHTASSGEGIVVAFRGRPQTRSFGQYTAGVSTSNDSIPLSDGAMLLLTTSVFADRTGHTYGDRIDADEVVDDVRKLTSIMEEAIPQPAIDWLMSQPACTARK